MLNHNLWKHILIGMVLGVVVGLALSPVGGGLIEDMDVAKAVGQWLALPGVIFLGGIMMVIVPLVVSSIVLGISGSGDAGFVKRLGLRIVPYFVLTSLVAVLIGIGLVSFIKPGLLVDGQVLLAGAEADPAAGRTFEDLTVPQRVANLIPVNFVKAAYNLDMLQIVIAAIVAGLAVLAVPREIIKPFVDVCIGVQALTMKVIEWAMMIAPFAVFGLIADVMIRIGPGAFAGLGGYFATVVAGLFAMFIVYMMIVAVVARRSPLAFLADVKEAQLLAFSTSSSSATMPVSIRVAEDNMKEHPDVVRFVIPLGATINMDGTALYQAVAAIFLCQLVGIELSLAETLVLAFTMVGASIGTPSTPGVGIVVLSTIVAGLGVPAAGIGLILGVDRILDMMRTTINVTGDLTATAVMDRFMHTKTAPVTGAV
ncbi:MAG: dicarboxylate/amino acid:cation symporter [Alphaproteobacteria bacterium]|nr:dicarboxylate/amino acid:cation symporter [Alphaproteobacteria bacterium]